jgi:hypothetical protein
VGAGAVAVRTGAARTRHGPGDAETFSIVDLTQDVLEKFALPAEAKHLQLRAGVPPVCLP